MADLIRFVDSIDASPTVRLDLNDEAYFWTKRFDAALPRLRRSMSSNAMRDGISVGSATYDGRTLSIELEMIQATQDIAATWLQKLWRELDRPTNILMYQPNALTKPVFFRTFRSDTSQLEDVMAQAAMRRFTIEVLAEPFALGLMETPGPYVVSNSPAALANPCYVDLPDILGDVPTPLVYWDASDTPYGGRTVAAWATSDPQHMYEQAENMTFGTGTTNPGGAAAGGFSGTGTTNYALTTFGTSTMTTRLSWVPSGTDGVCAGRWRVLAFVALTAGSTGYTVRGVVGSGQTGDTVTLPNTSSRVMVDLGVFSFGDAANVGAGYSSAGGSINPPELKLQAAGSTATSLRWDCVILLPAGGQVGTAGITAAQMRTGANAFLDGIRETAGSISTGSNPVAGTGTRSFSNTTMSGGFPVAHPGQTNRLYVFSYSSTDGAAAVSEAVTVNASYWPRYLLIRAISS